MDPVGLLRYRVQRAGSAHDLSLGDVGHEDGVAYSGHEGHPLLAVTRLSRVNPTLHPACLF